MSMKCFLVSLNHSSDILLMSFLEMSKLVNNQELVSIFSIITQVGKNSSFLFGHLKEN